MLNHRQNSPVNSANALYRHGDVLLRRIGTIPNHAQKRLGTVLAHGEVTGHSHRVQPSDAVQLWAHGNEMFLEVKQTGATLIHEEHRAIELPPGIYRVWKQREYRPDAYVEVED
ncbi:hypothetical protein ACQFX9_26990 [Aliinostoc sp. HNIBRCY26]|uniref:hypothetical protein n=1 Tax=Aliinostoc sp. HNIBRCY26 TaxID=3418997 RepID=UPI003D045581